MPPAGHASSRLVRPHGGRAGAGDLRFSHVLGGLSAALDLAEGHPPGHAARAALIGLRLAKVIGFNESEQAKSFDDLVAWVRQGIKPQGDDVFADFRDAGRPFTNPLRDGDPGGLTVRPSVAVKH